MKRITIISKLRFWAILAPALLLIAAPILAISFYAFGETPRILYQNQIAGLRAAQGMEITLYRMDWGRSQPEGGQIVRDQQRRFRTWLGSARGHAENQQQVDQLAAIVQAAEPLFHDMLRADPLDPVVEAKLRELHRMLTELIAADDQVMLAVLGRARLRARIMIGVILALGVVVPWLCGTVLVRLSGRLGRGLRSLRDELEKLSDAEGKLPAMLGPIDRTLSRLGFPKPDPMLAE